MTVNISIDPVDARILAELQTNGRLSIAELARTITMSHSATAERVRRLEESGVITGYTARVDPEVLGYSVLAFLRLRYPDRKYDRLHALLKKMPEVMEAHHVTGEDCFIIKILARNMRHLEELTGRIGGLGGVTTNVVYSSPLASSPVVPPERDRPE